MIFSLEMKEDNLFFSNCEVGALLVEIFIKFPCKRLITVTMHDEMQLLYVSRDGL